ncbi:MAG: aminotransferase class I/II-fold pyridoxal phosphate-dependent enzyme [Acidimicrobiia bacterium]
MAGTEMEMISDAVASNWVAPLGPHVDAFEAEFAAAVQLPHSVALSSGTAGLHLALVTLGVGPGDKVICPTLTFAATANAITYVGAEPVFVDADPASWNLDPTLLESELARRRPAAVITVDLYGQSADHERILKICDRYEIPVIEDAAEALGATYRGRPVGGFGRMGVFSFNGNKIITTSGGGMLVCRDESTAEHIRHLATQARDPAPHYQHSKIGFNYRMSNVLAAIGRAQLEVLDERVAARRRNFDHYVELLGDLPGVGFMPEAATGVSNRWLTCITIDQDALGVGPTELREALEAENIEARPVWKPMHLQPVFAKSRSVGGEIAEGIFQHGLCLPSGSALAAPDRERVCSIIRRTAGQT